jgi:hypothetical protein
MVFKINQATIDRVSSMAVVVAVDSASQPQKILSINFPVAAGAGSEKDDLIAAAKAVLQQAASEI